MASFKLNFLNKIKANKIFQMNKKMKLLLVFYISFFLTKKNFS